MSPTSKGRGTVKGKGKREGEERGRMGVVSWLPEGKGREVFCLG